ncbi:MAG: L,D-transpeptidase [Candidatus Melainabacteria bacterium]|nr:L,D-transpeptidase [Candidatus Melainabacteria bacterium]
MRKIPPVVRSLFCFCLALVLSLSPLAQSAFGSAAAYTYEPEKRAVVVVDKADFRTHVVQVQADGLPHVVFSAANAHARAGYETPAGRFEVLRPVLDPYWRNPWTNQLFAPYSRDQGNPMGVAAITISSGVALHGTNSPQSIGTRASHGCIRHQNRDILRIIHLVIPGTVVYVFEQIDESALSFAQLVAADFDWENSRLFQELNKPSSQADSPQRGDSGSLEVNVD